VPGTTMVQRVAHRLPFDFDRLGLALCPWAAGPRRFAAWPISRSSAMPRRHSQPPCHLILNSRLTLWHGHSSEAGLLLSHPCRAKKAGTFSGI
jgi:hypothetical protein